VFGGLFLAALAIIAVTFTARIPLVVVVIFAGIGVGTVWTNSDALVSTLVNRGQLGANIGAALSFKEFGDMVGPLLVGTITQWFGVRVDLSTAARWRWPVWSWLISRPLRRAEKLR
jgi:MFS family permease